MTSGPDFLHVDRHEWTQQGPKMARLHNPKEFFEILHNKRGQDVHENYVNGFSKKKIHFGQMDHFGLENGVTS